mmetsp:Transcript_24709/g.32255  ORF Transcript_24709/g.32255 Transcript_24709/m.32255 type:complete len:213 (+) Transcript_24709:57-695(+)
MEFTRSALFLAVLCVFFSYSYSFSVSPYFKVLNAGHQKTLVAMKLNEGESKGEYDWDAEFAKVKKQMANDDAVKVSPVEDDKVSGEIKTGQYEEAEEKATNQAVKELMLFEKRREIKLGKDVEDIKGFRFIGDQEEEEIQRRQLAVQTDLEMRLLEFFSSGKALLSAGIGVTLFAGWMAIALSTGNLKNINQELYEAGFQPPSPSITSGLQD